MHTKFYSDDLKGRDHAVDLGVDGRYIRMDFEEIERENVDWRLLARDRDRRRAVVNAVVILRVA
jgi:hypothetical protein